MKVLLRGPVTDDLIDYLGTQLVGLAVLIGDGEAPRAGGWTGGQPGEGEFQAYTVLSTGPARVNNRDPLANNSTSWLASYTLRSVGTSRTQADWAADTTRAAVASYAKRNIEVATGNIWSVQRAVYETLGPVTRIDATKPAHWELADTFTLQLEASP